MKNIIFLALTVFLVGCEERYRYPCQDPDNWEKKECKVPYCSANGTCPEDLSHYLKDKEAQQKSMINNQRQTCGACQK